MFANQVMSAIQVKMFMRPEAVEQLRDRLS
jgi:hypothetical protein